MAKGMPSSVSRVPRDPPSPASGRSEEIPACFTSPAFWRRWREAPDEGLPLTICDSPAGFGRSAKLKGNICVTQPWGADFPGLACVLMLVGKLNLRFAAHRFRHAIPNS